MAGKFITEDSELAEFQEYEGAVMALHIIQATRSAHFTQEQIRKFEDTSKDLLDLTKDVDTKPEKYNLDVRNAFRRFREWWKSLKMNLPTLSIIFHIGTKGDEVHLNVKDQGKALNDLITSLFPCQCEVVYYNAKRLLEMAKMSRREPVELKFVTSLASSHWGKAYVCLVKLSDYINVLTTSSGERREYILEPNVRAYLGTKGVNADIHKTLLNSKSPDEFWWLNNGITMTASKIAAEINSLVLTDARIVNGLQTSREIYNYFQQQKTAKNDERHVLVKVLEADTKSARLITRTTNNQTKIDPMYLRTTIDEIHDRIEMALPRFGFNYERVKNQYHDNDNVPKDSIITLGYLNRALIAIFLQEPQQARGGPGKYVDRHYNKLFSQGSKPEFFGNTLLLMKRVEGFVKANVPVRNDQTNLKYYMAFDAACCIAKKSHIQRGTVTNMKLEKVTDELLASSLARVKHVYETLRDELAEEPDVVAKGGQMTGRLKERLKQIYPIKTKNAASHPH